MRHFLAIIFILSSLWATSQTKPGRGLAGDSSKTSLTTKLGIPFGTIVKLEAEIYDGDKLHMKVYEGEYLLKINHVNGKMMKAPIILTFTDETGTLADHDFGLYKLIYKKNANSLSDVQISKMKKKYVGKRLTLMAYETGHFIGIPTGYFNYRPIRADVGFHFEHYLVVVSDLTR